MKSKEQAFCSQRQLQQCFGLNKISTEKIQVSLQNISSPSFSTHTFLQYSFILS
eukprot:m.248551 g.248551  ORF g.248551 m.248551 type:complete len:54 (+) comp59997_c0_seq1:72-233(+)